MGRTLDEIIAGLPPERRGSIDARYRELKLALSDEEERLLAQARDDFKHGRALDADAYYAEMSAFIKRLATQATS